MSEIFFYNVDYNNGDTRTEKNNSQKEAEAIKEGAPFTSPIALKPAKAGADNR